MIRFLLITGFLGILLLNILDISNLGLVEPVFLVLFLLRSIRVKKDKILDLGTIYVVGQLLISASNFQLSNFVTQGQSGGMYNYIVNDYISEGLNIRFIGSLFFLIGYESLSKSRVLIRNTIDSNRVNLLLILAGVIILNNHVFYFSLPGAFGSLLNWIPYACIIMLARHAYLHDDASTRFKALGLMITLVILAFLFAILRTEMLLPIISYFLGVFLAKPKVSFFLTPRFYPFYGSLVVFMLFFLAFQQIRSTTYGSDRFTAIVQAQEVVEEDALDTEEKSGAFQRAADLAQITNVVDLKVNNKFNQGETLTVLAVALIPRVLWPGKPKIALGVWFAIKIGKALPTDNGWYNTSINMTVPGHLWMELGYLGVIFGMFFIGLFYKFIWTSCGSLSEPLNFMGTLLCGFLLLTVLSGIGADLQIVVTLLALFLIVLTLSNFIRFVSVK
ncbi:MAG: hypothetical protein COA58_01540 [Bacteroidetes bacterium]|nr:MAG: hypothetical protein COA58_01540 [Bacteroidota bacterium]